MASMVHTIQLKCSLIVSIRHCTTWLFLWCFGQKKKEKGVPQPVTDEQGKE